MSEIGKVKALVRQRMIAHRRAGTSNVDMVIVDELRILLKLLDERAHEDMTPEQVVTTQQYIDRAAGRR